jgi:predicted nucleic-acid-binding Zn-ribbon protein
MTFKASSPMREFFIECIRCGTYPISEKTARMYIAPKLRRELDDRLKRGAVGAKLRFKRHCPKCKPESAYLIEVSALTRKIQ